MPFDLMVLGSDSLRARTSNRRIVSDNHIVERLRTVGLERHLDHARRIVQQIESVLPENAGLIVVTVPPRNDGISHGCEPQRRPPSPCTRCKLTRRAYTTARS